MAQFIALGRRNSERFSEADFAPLLEPEAERARQLYAQGTFRAMWSRKDVPGAVIVIEAETLAEAEGFLNTLPLKAKGMLDFDAVIPLGPYRGFGPRA
jgi:muconolactone delta-isomerase